MLLQTNEQVIRETNQYLPATQRLLKNTPPNKGKIYCSETTASQKTPHALIRSQIKLSTNCHSVEVFITARDIYLSNDAIPDTQKLHMNSQLTYTHCEYDKRIR